MENRFKISIGDYSGDGHSIVEHYIIACNHTVKEVGQAYKDSCKLTGISFNDNVDYTQLNRAWEVAAKYKIAVEYQDSYISTECQKALLEHGIDVWEGFNKEEYKDDQIHMEDPEDFLELLMKFIKISLKDLEYKIVTDDLPSLNAWGNSPLHCHLGYGLFD
jgi:hypothetical protein